MTLQERITDYLMKGGNFNPELMEHDKVRQLLIDCRDALDAKVMTCDCASDPHHPQCISRRTTSPTVVCNRCKGLGTIRRGWAENQKRVHWTTTTCPDCRGVK